jgi:hypothetical protein
MERDVEALMLAALPASARKPLISALQAIVGLQDADR